MPSLISACNSACGNLPRQWSQLPESRAVASLWLNAISGTSMYQVIGTGKSRALRVLWMLEELGQPYEHVPVNPHSEG